MNELEIIDFPIQNWVKIIIILGTVLMLFSRLYIGDRFQYLFSFWNIHRYFHYKSGETISLFTTNNIIMFFLRILTTALFLFMLFRDNYLTDQKEFFIKLCIGLSVLLLLKFIIENIFSLIFKFKKKLNEVNRYRIGIKNLFSVHLYFFLIIMIFGDLPLENIYTISLTLFLIYNGIYLKFILNKYLINGFKSSCIFYFVHLHVRNRTNVFGVIYLIK